MSTLPAVNVPEPETITPAPKTSLEGKSPPKGGGLQLVLVSELEAEKAPPKPKISRARQRLARATLSVINQVIEKKDAENTDNDKKEEENTNNNNEQANSELKVEDKKLGVTVSARNRKKSAVGSAVIVKAQGNEKKKAEPKKKKAMSLASVVGMASFRKIYMNRLLAQANAEVTHRMHSPVPEVDEDLEAMPQRPRFIATLSPEAQFAALKGYEDMLVTNLQKSYPDKKNTLYRVRTPSSKKVTLPLEAIMPAKPKNELLPPASSSLYPPRPSSAMSNSSQFSDIAYTENSEVKRRLSVRFQVGMDILDQMKTSQGYLITSPRIKQHEIEPLPTYNQWIRKWSKEFSLDDPEKEG